MKLIYEKSAPGRRAARAPHRTVPLKTFINPRLLRERPAELPEAPEIEVVRHFVNLSADELLRGHPLLSAGLLHDEV